MNLLIVSVIVLTLGVGAAALWANPWRFVNQVFAAFSLTSALWVSFVLLALVVGSRYPADLNADPVPWLRAAAAIGALFPWLLWLLKESVVEESSAARKVLLRSWPWFFTACLLAALTCTGYFIPFDSTPENPQRGVGYLFYTVISLLLYLILVFEAVRQMRVQTGVRRIEMQFLTVNAGIACFLAIIINAVAAYLDLRVVARLSLVTVLLFYALTAWAVTFHRVFDARHVFISLGQRLALITALCVGILGLQYLFAPFISAPFDLILSIALTGPLAFWLDRSSRDWLRLSPAQHVAALRRSITDLARAQHDPDKLVGEFEQLLRTGYQASFASLLFDSGEIYAGADLQLAKSRTGHAALCKSGWATPESLQRQRAAPGRVDLRQILTEHNLGLVVTAPPGSTEPTLVATLGVKVNHRPFTYPEVQQLQDVVEFMDNILARSRLILQARQSEQLAVIGLVGASLAHEIRNPLVSIKTFAHLLPTRFDDREFRRKFNQLIPAEVDRIDGLTQQLLDLAHPRSHLLERVALHGIVRDTLDLIQTNAAKAQVSLTPRLAAAPDTIHADSSAIRQVLINLLINAVQALEAQEGARAVDISTRSLTNGVVVLEITDNGPGIPADQRSRLFRPFASTKTRGIGLGLAICADILREHRATINVPDTGRPGATFRITFPCPPPSS